MKFFNCLPLLAVSAAVITSASANVTVNWVTVGNAGNTADTTGYGAVSYQYAIGKYEVTNAQYTVFLNTVDAAGTNPNGIYNANMGSNARGGISFDSGANNGSKYATKADMDNKPVNYVSWYDAARFTNWLHNGQGTGSTETGAYTLNGNTGVILKNEGAKVWLPSENEWYKAAYYDSTRNGGSGGYWTYATQSNTVPTVATADGSGNVTNPGANVVNYATGADWNSQNGNLTTVGSAGANNFYGTADMNGNVWEWNDAVISTTNRGMRGGAWFGSSGNLASATRTDEAPSRETYDFGFRLASSSIAAVPEPSGMVLSLLLISGCVCRRQR